ncbi:MAG: hypothetical protein RLZZ385_868 [Pseudomonadota bacterium]|jgi:cation:H+ antiporter
MLISSLQLLAGLALLYFGGEALVWGAYSLARRIGISPLAIGLTVVAFGTSMPELVVSVDAARAGADDISLGNVVGSNIANIALILGLAAVISPTRAESKIVRLDSPIMIATSVLLILMLANGILSRLEGLLLLAGLVAFTGFTFWQANRQSALQAFAADTADMLPSANTLKTIGLIIAGLVLLVVGGHLVVEGAVAIATVLGLSQATIGLTIVAVGTSLPELSTSVVAAMRRQGDIAIGNVVGSNIFNILGILGITAAFLPLERGAIDWLDLGLMTALAVLLPALLHYRKALHRREGILLLVSFTAYTTWLLVAN